MGIPTKANRRCSTNSDASDASRLSVQKDDDDLVLPDAEEMEATPRDSLGLPTSLSFLEACADTDYEQEQTDVQLDVEQMISGGGPRAKLHVFFFNTMAFLRN